MMQDDEQSTVSIKSNIALKGGDESRPIDAMPREYFDVRVPKTPRHQKQLDKYIFWAKRVCDENGNPVNDECYKACEDCATATNCQRPRKL
jgi:hypothetical protein